MICYYDGDEWYPVFTISLTKDDCCYQQEIELPEEDVANIIKAQEDFDKAQDILRRVIKAKGLGW